MSEQPAWRRGPDGQLFRRKKDDSWWWEAADGNWYPESQHPSYRPAAPPPPPPPAQPAPPAPVYSPSTEARAPAGAVMQVQSHEEGRNATVTLYADRIERVQDRKRLSVSRAKQDSEVIPMRAVSSVQAKKDGMAYTKVTIFASGNTIEFRLRHDDARRFKDAVTAAIL